ncbi:hypothetical protein SAMN04487897_103328 [Paenibacillus sp. yr247]|uniref:hypothetical protein n=1 Tax=Paenibacillus sp. yr247 TaxID=1761880 RepID=UPI000881C9F7|nr:hypothetical protein [Paenibacillus sp. yr247]SDN60892.1 hypothetical protein SAMN04487897_103328 [Paenibacillus sp. yr247]
MRAISSGPFVVPRTTEGTEPEPTFLFVSLNNPTDKERTVTVILFRAPISFVCVPPTTTVPPPQPSTEAELGRATVTLVDHESFVVAFASSTPTPLFDQNDILRLVVQGGVANPNKSDGIQVSVVGRQAGTVTQEPTMFFRHKDFIETKA